MESILIATKNEGKVAEFKTLFNKYKITIQSLHDLNEPIPDILETGKTFKENARIKAEQICKKLNRAVIADDSGLVIDALDGRPGIYSARYAHDQATDEENNEKVLNELKNITMPQRTARFVTVLALAIPNEPMIYTRGVCEGKIATEPKGTNGFGYDPIFIPDGYNKTLAELSNDVKNKISHRYHALQSLEDVIMR